MSQASESDLFDPTGHTVAEVTEYLATASGDEVERVQAVEAAQEKPRKGIVEYVPGPAEGEDGYTRQVVSSPEMDAAAQADETDT